MDRRRADVPSEQRLEEVIALAQFLLLLGFTSPAVSRGLRLINAISCDREKFEGCYRPRPEKCCVDLISRDAVLWDYELYLILELKGAIC